MNLKKPLAQLFPEKEVNNVFKSYEVLGDIAIISLSSAFESRETEIAQVILSAYPALRLVAKRLGNHSGEFRIAPLQRIEGEGSFVTVHKEFGLHLHVDPDNVYFSPRNGSERYRIAQQVNPGERVLVMFSGIGPLALMVGMYSEAADIIGVEKNPYAYNWALRNVEENRKSKNINFLHGDVTDVLLHINKQFDRIAMPLPLSAEAYLHLTLRYLLPGGMLHFYDFQYKNEFDLSLQTLQKSCVASERHISSYAIHQCGHVGPRRYRVCVDARIK